MQVKVQVKVQSQAQSQSQAPPPFKSQLLSALPRLRRYARSLAFDPSVADDITQSTVERALTHWHQFDQQRNMLVWLLSIAHNAYLDMLRRESRTTPTADAELHRVMDAGATDPTENMGHRIDLMAALQTLSPDQREPLLLVCVEQLSYAEVAEVLHVPVGTVMSRVFRARANLRRVLDGHASAGSASATDGPAKAVVPATLRRVV